MFSQTSRRRAMRIVLTGIIGGFAAFFIALAPTAAVAQGVRLELQDRKIDDNVWPAGQWTLTDGKLHQSLYEGSYTTDHSWSDPPLSMDSAGFYISLNITGHVVCSLLSAGTSIGKTDFKIEGDVYSTDLEINSDNTNRPNCPPADGSNSVTLHILPGDNLAEGEELTLHVGASYGPGVTYTYKVVSAGSGDEPEPGDEPTPTKQKFALKVAVDCPNRIVIGELPGLQCALDISGYNRNSSKDVVVSVPTAVDGHDNTQSGIQLTGISAAASPSNWDSSYHWTFSPFACKQNSPGVGANCYENFAVPGPVSIPVVVSQEGVGAVTVTLMFDVVGDGSDVGTTSGIEFRIGNRLRDGTFVNIETGTLQSTQVLLDWLSARWSIEVVDGSDPQAVRIRSLWKPDLYLNVEQGPLVAGPIQPTWLSALWILEGPTPDQFGSYFYRIRNAWQMSLMLDVDGSGNVIVAADQPGSPSQDFWLLY